MKNVLFVYLFAVNIAALILYGVDKARAKDRKRRISEKALLGIAIIGGSVGAILGMLAFHHKTRHWYFRYGLWVILIIQILLICIFYKRLEI